jgi:hypothetical protein
VLVAKTDLPVRERAQAVRALDHLDAHDDKPARVIAAALEEDPSPEITIAGAEFLGRAPRKVAVPALLRLMDSSDATVRERAHASLLPLAGSVVIQPDVDPFGYDPSANATREERADALRSWHEWWDIHQDR